MLAIVHNPFPLVELLLLPIGIDKVLHTLFIGQAINPTFAVRHQNRCY